MWNMWFGPGIDLTLKLGNRGFAGHMVYSTREVLSGGNDEGHDVRKQEDSFDLEDIPGFCLRNLRT